MSKNQANAGGQPDPAAEAEAARIAAAEQEAKDKKAAEEEAARRAAEASKVKTVKMVRSELDANGGPTTADVHPEEVGNYAKYGWRAA